MEDHHSSTSKYLSTEYSPQLWYIVGLQQKLFSYIRVLVNMEILIALFILADKCKQWEETTVYIGSQCTHC